ncbi:hypothetical protein ACGFNU_08265 [Spirillospora sp. NPDC048911]|uniref:hypothetical protein n=1 Tax=Spirillospora sp. NPDC048911 TaxID=3364527 RepID=UPI00371E4A91
MTPALARAAAIGCAALSALTVSAFAQPASAAGPWHTVPLPFFWPNAHLADVEAEAADKVWVAGGQGSFCIQWFPMTPCAASSDGNPVVRRWNGSGWTEYPVNGWSGQGRMQRVAAGGGEVWARGYSFTTGQYLAKFDGSAFVPAAPPGSGELGLLRAGAAGTWASTTSAAVDHLFRRTGTGWTPSEVPASLKYIGDLQARTADDVWAVGQTYPDHATYGVEDVPAIAHWNGTSWTSVPAPTQEPAATERVLKVAPAGPDDVWAITFKSLIHWNGGSWTVIPVPETTAELKNVVVDGAGTPWVVMSNTADGLRYRLYRYTGAWEQVPVPSTTSVSDIDAVPGAGTVWGVGSNDRWPAAFTNG